MDKKKNYENSGRKSKIKLKLKKFYYYYLSLFCIFGFTFHIFIIFSASISAMPIPFGPTKTDPGLHWKTLSTEHFSIHFYQGEEKLAQKTAEIAERVHTRLTQYIMWIPKEKTQIIINDTVDIVNGAATPSPYNTIFIYPSQPVLGLGHFDEWLEILITHEYVHILDIDRVGGLSEILQKIVGRFWFPKMFSDLMFTEGFAVYNETLHTNGGRGRDPYIDMFVRMAFLSGDLPKLDQLNGFCSQWPGGYAAYIYGGELYKFIAEKSNEDALLYFQRSMANGLSPWNANSTAQFTTGRSLQFIWEEWKYESMKKYQSQAKVIREKGVTNTQQITTSGFYKWSPVWDPKGDMLYYFEANSDEYPTIRSIEPFLKKDKAIMRLNTTTTEPSFSISPDGEQLIIPQGEFSGSFSVYNDIWTKNLKNGDTERMTRKYRASDPAWSPNGDHILFITTSKGETGLDSISLESKGISNILPAGDMIFSEPAWARDSKAFAVSVWQKGGYQDIWVFNADGSNGQPLLHDKYWDISPCWTEDGKYVLFASDRTGVYNIFALELETNDLYQITNVLGGAFDPSVSPDGKQLAFVGYSSSGFDINLMPLDKMEWKPTNETIGNSVDMVDFATGFNPEINTEPSYQNNLLNTDNLSSDYNPLSTLRPRFWIPLPTVDDTGMALAFLTMGRDVLGKHTFMAQAQYGIDSNRFGYILDYVNDQLYPSISISIWDYPNMIQPLENETADEDDPYYWYWSRGGALLIQFPYIKAKYQQWLTLGLERQRTDFQYQLPDESHSPFSGDLGDIVAEWSFDNSHRYLTSISPTDGVKCSIAYRRYLPSLGSDYTFSEIAGDVRLYIPMPIKRHVIALKGQFMQNNIDLQKFHPDRGNFIVRGFNDLYADDVISGSAEYRFPLLEIQRGIKLWPLSVPIFFQRLHACVFTDYASLSNIQEEKTRFSTGAEVRLDTIAGNLFQINFRAVLALPVKPEGESTILIGLGEVF